MHRVMGLVVAGWVVAAAPAAAQSDGAIPWIPRSDLPDAAQAIADPLRPVILYNPALLARHGPAVGRFIRAHETAHVRLAHDPVAFAGLDPDGRARAHRQAELEADCAGARALATTDRAAVQAAIAFFRGRGPARASALHPAGTERAAALRACLQDLEVSFAGIAGR